MTDSNNDGELLAAWQAGDMDAGAALFEKHYECIARFFRNKVSGPIQDDLVQQTFLICAEKAAQFRRDSSFRTYAFGIAHNVLREYLRNVGRRRRRESDEIMNLDELSITALGQCPVSFVAAKQEQRLLLEGLRTIAVHYQVVLELYYWEQLTAREIADIIGVPLGTAKTRLRDGKKALTRELTRLASSADVLRSTLDNLEHWAARIQGQARDEVKSSS